MSPAVEVIHGELAYRRQRLVGLLAGTAPEDLYGAGGVDRVMGLLLRVDAALERLDDGTFGLCNVCHGEVNEDRLLRDPLATVCLECMTPSQSKALERDLETASRFQATLLPDRHVRHEGWEAAYLYEPFGAVSGDTLDWIVPATPGTPLDVLFGDVSGKGVAASLLQSNLRALFRALACPDTSPGDLLAKINRLFREATTQSAYATALTLRLHPDGAVEYANAGHLPLLRAGNGHVGELGRPSLPLGLFPDAEYAASRFALAPGEALLLYTDGLTEPARRDGEEYGRERALAVFSRLADRSPDEILAAVRADLDLFLAGASRSDDLSLLVVRRAA